MGIPCPLMKKNRLLITVAAVVLLSAFALQFMHVPNVKDGVAGGGTAAGDLAKAVPVQTGGWIGKEEKLGPSEFVSDAAARVLNFDDYLYRIYQKDGRSLGVYIAHWAPGRMPTHKVASHTPDRCWTENGWKCNETKFAVPIQAGDKTFKPAEWRRFTPPGGGPTQYVLYWHLVGDELYDYGARFNARPDPVKWVRDSIAYAVKGSQVQYFIRLTSNRPMDDLLADPTLGELWRSLGALGLEAGSDAGADSAPTLAAK